MFEYTFFVEGKAIAQGSKKSYGNGIMVETNDKALKRWRKAIVEKAAPLRGDNDLIDGPVSVALTVYLEKPRTTKFRRYPAGPPDLDKLQRAVGDALTTSQLIKDDARIVHWEPWKRWADDETPPGALIQVTEL